MIIEKKVAKIYGGDLVFRKDVGDEGIELAGKLCEIPEIVEMIQNFLIHGMVNKNESIQTSNK